MDTEQEKTYEKNWLGTKEGNSQKKMSDMWLFGME